MKIKYTRETSPEFIQAAEAAYREAPPLERGRFDETRGRRAQVLRRAREQQVQQHAA